MLKRKVYNELLEWKEKHLKTAAFLSGARQIGKSTIAREFGKQEFSRLIEINFIDQPEMKSIFQNRNAREILTAITAAFQVSIIPGDTLILLDEIQECPEARTAIKFLVEEGRCRYIETGSLLGVRWKEVRSYPVGYERQIPMFPMDLEEFLWAVNMPAEVLDLLKHAYQNRQSVPEAVHQTMLKLFYTWMIVGGMPAAVASYVQNGDLALVQEIQSDILALYRMDIAKYAGSSEKNKIREIFDSIPAQLDSKTSRFMLSRLNVNARMNRYENSFLWLSEAGTALPCFNVAAPVVPLSLNRKRNLFKLFMSDTGLLCAASLGNLQLPLLNGQVDINAGSILENAFAQALISKKLDLYYYDQKKLGELDFVVQNGKSIDLFEIKSGNDYRNHTALDKALDVGEWDFRQAIVFSKGNVQQEGKVLYLPFYMILYYEPEKLPESLIWKVSLDELEGFMQRS